MPSRYVNALAAFLILVAILYYYKVHHYYGPTSTIISVFNIFNESFSPSPPSLPIVTELRVDNTSWERILNINVTTNYLNNYSCQAILEFLLLKPGLTELSQLQTFFNIPQSLMQKVSNNAGTIRAQLFYNYTMRVYDNCIYFLVHEHRLNSSDRSTELPHGGTGFHTIVEGKQSIAYCPYVDFRNNTYAIFCPLHEYCVNVSSSLFYFDYLAFARTRYIPDYQIVFYSYICYNSSLYFPKPNLYWTKNDNSENNNTSPFSWKLTGRVKEPLTTSQLKTCIAPADVSFNFIGDSHSRNMAYYFCLLNGNLEKSPGTHSDLDLGKIRLYFTTFVIDSFLPKVRRVLTIFKFNTSKVFTIMNVGTWNMDIRGVSHFAKVAIPAFRQEMLAMQRDGLFDKRKVLFYAMPSAPLWKSAIVNRRNTMATAAVYRLMVDALSDINVTFFEYFTLSRQFANKTAPNDLHYLVTRTNGSVGYVGMELANYVLQILCTEMKK